MGKKLFSFTIKAKRKNPYALGTLLRSGAGRHVVKKMARDRLACRGRVVLDQEDYEDMEGDHAYWRDYAEALDEEEEWREWQRPEWEKYSHYPKEV